MTRMTRYLETFENKIKQNKINGFQNIFYLFYKSFKYPVILSFACHFRFTFDFQLYSLFVTT